MAGVPAARKKTGTTPGHPTDIKIGICRGLGLSRDDTAAMAGCSVPTVDLRKDEPAAKEWEDWTRRACSAFVASTKEHFEAQIRRRIGRSMDVIDRALDNDDVNTALKGVDRVLDRAFGKATQRVETTSDVTERVIHELPQGALEAVRAIAEAMRPKRLTGEVIDVQQVEEN